MFIVGAAAQAACMVVVDSAERVNKTAIALLQCQALRVKADRNIPWPHRISGQDYQQMTADSADYDVLRTWRQAKGLQIVGENGSTAESAHEHILGQIVHGCRYQVVEH